MIREKQNKKNDGRLSPEMATKMREIRPKKWGRLSWWEGFMEKVSFESGLEWNWDGVMHNESGDDDNDDELVRQRWDDSDRGSSSTGLRSSLESLFQRRGEAWRKEQLLTFKEEYKGGWASWQHQRKDCCNVVEEAR